VKKTIILIKFMTQPKKTKFKKTQKGKNFRLITSTYFFNKIQFNSVVLRSVSGGVLTSKHYDMLKLGLQKLLKKQGKIFMLFYSHKPISKKPLEVRMGKGKGAINSWGSRIGYGQDLCKVYLNNVLIGEKAMLIVKQKLPIETKIIIH